jgi:hypothetical protein
MDSHQATGKIFNNLTMWRNLPKYQLERRADIFFSLYLKEILEAKFSSDGNHVELSPVIIPEFPIQQGVQHHTANVDYVMFSENLKTVYLIEFKTDMGSFRSEQYEYLVRAKKKIQDQGFKKIVEELWSVFKATDDKQKYFHLFKQLKDIGLFELPFGLKEFVFPKVKRGLTDLIDWHKEKLKCSSINHVVLVFLQPAYSENQKQENELKKLLKDFDLPENLNDISIITFEDVCGRLTTLQDSFAGLFASYIQAWTQRDENNQLYQAGARTPETIAADIIKLTAKSHDDETL